MDGTVAAPVAPAGSVPPTPRRGRRALLAVGAVAACLVLGALVGGGAYLMTRDAGGAEEPILDLSVVPPGSFDGTPVAPPDNGEPADAERPPSSPPEEPATLSGVSPGRYIQAGSFRSPDGAQQEVDRLQGRGIDAWAMPAAETNELLPGFHVLLVGPLSGSGDEKRVIRELDEAGVSGFGRDLTPSAALSGPEAAAGSWSGNLERSHLRGSRRPSFQRIDFALSTDGEEGTVSYPGRGCSGSLALVEDAGYSLAYRESIESGPCPPGGVWHLRPQGAEVTAVWLHDDLHVMVHGEAGAG